MGAWSKCLLNADRHRASTIPVPVFEHSHSSEFVLNVHFEQYFQKGAMRDGIKGLIKVQTDVHRLPFIPQVDLSIKCNQSRKARLHEHMLTVPEHSFMLQLTFSRNQGDHLWSFCRHWGQDRAADWDFSHGPFCRWAWCCLTSSQQRSPRPLVNCWEGSSYSVHLTLSGWILSGSVDLCWADTLVPWNFSDHRWKITASLITVFYFWGLGSPRSIVIEDWSQKKALNASVLSSAFLVRSVYPLVYIRIYVRIN